MIRTLWAGLLLLSSMCASASPITAWSDAQIMASRVDVAPTTVLTGPLAAAGIPDPLNLFVVLTRDGRSLSLIDGDRFEILGRITLARPAAGEPQFSPNGRFAYLGSEDGWITQVDLWQQQVVAEVRAGLVQRQIAISSDGHWLLVANTQPATLVLLNARLQFDRLYAGETLDKRLKSSFAAVVDAALRPSFVVALASIPEVWEISYNPRAEHIYDGIVHDFRMGEGIPRPGYLGVRRTRLPQPLTDLVVDLSQGQVLGQGRAADGQPDGWHVVNLDVRRRIADLPLSAGAALAGSVSWLRQGTPLLATPNPTQQRLEIIDARRWEPVRQLGAVSGRWVRSHPAAGQLWVGGGEASSVLTVVDKDRLEVLHRVELPEGSTASFDFNRKGDIVAAVVGSDQVVFYDVSTAKPMHRVRADQAAAVFNVRRALWNSRIEGR